MLVFYCCYNTLPYISSFKHKYIISQFYGPEVPWGSQGWNRGISRAVSLLRLWARVLSLLFWVLAVHGLWDWGPHSLAGCHLGSPLAPGGLSLVIHTAPDTSAPAGPQVLLTLPSVWPSSTLTFLSLGTPKEGCLLLRTPMIRMGPLDNLGLPWWFSGKESTCQSKHPWVRKIPRRRKWQPTPVFLPGKSHGQRGLVGCSPWGCRESDTTESLSNNSWLVLSISRSTMLITPAKPLFAKSAHTFKGSGD